MEGIAIAEEIASFGGYLAGQASNYATGAATGYASDKVYEWLTAKGKGQGQKNLNASKGSKSHIVKRMPIRRARRSRRVTSVGTIRRYGTRAFQRAGRRPTRARQNYGRSFRRPYTRTARRCYARR